MNRLATTALVAATVALLAVAYYGGYAARANGAMPAGEEQLLEVGYNSGQVSDVNKLLESGWHLKAVYTRREVYSDTVQVALYSVSRGGVAGTIDWDIQVYHLVKSR